MEQFCTKCNKTMDEGQFYTYKNGTKTEMCKKCLTMHINNFDPGTFLWLLEKMDVPYIPSEWNVLRDRAYAKDPLKMNGMSVFGKYLSKMKLNQWKDFSWADTEDLGAKDEEKMKLHEEERVARENYAKEQFEQGIITEAQYKTLTSSLEQNKAFPPLNIPNPSGKATTYFDENQYMAEDALNSGIDQLTEEDKLMLAMKWGRLYKPNEWIELEKKYNEMMESFDIQDSDTKGTLILICKTYLKMNQAMDLGDFDGFNKLSRTYDSLRKSAKFTAAQNKEQKSNYVDCIGELVVLCEREEGFIPRYATDIPQDKVDLTLKDMNNYLRTLVTDNLGFGQQIEDAIKKIQLQKELNSQEEAQNEQEFTELTDENIIDYYEDIRGQQEMDAKLVADADEELDKEGDE